MKKNQIKYVSCRAEIALKIAKNTKNCLCGTNPEKNFFRKNKNILKKSHLFTTPAILGHLNLMRFRPKLVEQSFIR